MYQNSDFGVETWPAAGVRFHCGTQERPLFKESMNLSCERFDDSETRRNYNDPCMVL